jgi:hypothetical protein
MPNGLPRTTQGFTWSPQVGNQFTSLIHQFAITIVDVMDYD